MKNWINGFGSCFAMFTVLGFCWFIPYEYSRTGHGYTLAQRAAIERLMTEEAPLSVAHIGLDAELLGEYIRENE